MSGESNRLVVQHPQLADSAIGTISKVLNKAPHERQPSLAIWSNVQIDRVQLLRLAESQRVDAELVPARDPLNNYRLLACDMDSTLITVECIDEIADFAGKKGEVAAITEAAMRGEIDFATSLAKRVAHLAGTNASCLERVYDERVRLSEGAESLVQSCQRAGLQTVIATGGFNFFAKRLAKKLNIAHVKANDLDIVEGKLTGRVIGQVVDAQVKRDTVLQLCEQLGCGSEQTIVVGDGANDLQMMSVAGVSVAYRAKPIVRSESTRSVTYNGLDSILNFFTN